MSLNTFQCNFGLNNANQSFNIPENCQLQQTVDPMSIRYFVNGPEEIRKQIARMSLVDCEVDGEEVASVSAQEKPKILSEPAVTSTQCDVNGVKECSVLVVPLTEQELDQYKRKPHTSIACSSPVAEFAEMKTRDRRSKKKKSTSRSKKSHKKHKRRKQHRKEREMAGSSVQRDVAKSHRRKRKRSSSSDSLFEKVIVIVPKKKRRTSGISEPKTTSAKSSEAPPQLPIVQDPTPDCFIEGSFTFNMMTEMLEYPLMSAYIEQFCQQDSTPDVSMLENLLFQPTSCDEPGFPLDDEMELGSTLPVESETHDADQINPHDAHEDTPHNANQDNPNGAHQDNPNGAHQDNPNGAHQDNPNDAHQGNPHDTQRDNPNDAHQDNQALNLSMLKMEEEDGNPQDYQTQNLSILKMEEEDGNPQDAQQDYQTQNLSLFKMEEEDGNPQDAPQNNQTQNLSMLKMEEEDGNPQDVQQDYQTPNSSMSRMDEEDGNSQDAQQNNQTLNLSMLKTEAEDSGFEDHFYYCQDDVLIISIDEEEFLPMPPP